MSHHCSFFVPFVKVTIPAIAPVPMTGSTCSGVVSFDAARLRDAGKLQKAVIDLPEANGS